MAITYTSTPLPNGKVEIYADGVPMSQGGPGFDASYAAQLTGAPVANEPAALSTVSGKENFATNVQPAIDTANQTVAASSQLKATNAATQNESDALPQDVQNELDAQKTPEQIAYEQQIQSYDEQAQFVTDTYENLTLAATQSAQAQINSLTSQWNERRMLLEQQNKGVLANWNQQFIRFGQAEYSPGMTGQLLTDKEMEGARKVQELDDQYNAAVGSINSSLEEGNYARAAQMTQSLQDIKQKTLDLMAENARIARETNDALRENQARASRDSAIATLISQGITDPAQMLNFLNMDQNGEVTGDFTADEVSKVMKALTIDGNAKNLSADLSTFQYIRDNFGLPDNIANLPPEQQYFEYLRTIKRAQATVSSGYTLSTNQVRFDQNGNPVAFGPASKSSDNGVPTWEEYKSAATKLMNVNYLMAADEALLRKQYEEEYPGGMAPSEFTDSEMRKLEQAGLLNASRQEQLDYLYGNDSQGDVPDWLK